MLPYASIFAMMNGHKDAILAEGVNQAKALGVVSVDMIKTAAFGYAKTIAQQWLLPGATDLLNNAAASYIATHGPRPSTPDDAPDNVEWRDQFDEHVMDVIGKDMLSAASQDFVGEYLTDTAIDDVVVRQEATKAFCDRLVEAAVKARTAGQVLAEIGIVAEDLAPYATAATSTTAGAALTPVERVIDEATARMHVEHLVANYAIRIGAANFDPAALTELLKLAFDDEPFLALGPVNTLRGDDQGMSDVPYFTAYHKASKTCVEDTVQSAFLASMTGQLPDAPAAPKKPRDKKGNVTDVSPATVAPPPALGAAVQPAGDNFAEVIKLWSLHGAESDADIGKVIGKTRGTVGNIASGKSKCPLDPAQRKALAKILADHVNGLQRALALLG